MSELKSLIDLSWASVKSRDNDAAMAYAKQAHNISPNSSEVTHLLGLLASRDGQHDIALNLLQQSINQGGKSQRKLQDMSEALFAAGYAKEALIPLDEADKEYGACSASYGLRSAILLDIEDWSGALRAAQSASDSGEPNFAWYLNASFAALMQQDYIEGFEYATARDENLKSGARCALLSLSQPCDVWLRSEQGLGDTLFYLRFAKPFVDKGWTFHLDVDAKLVSVLERTKLFRTVGENNHCPDGEIWFNVGDLALAYFQAGEKAPPPPLPLVVNSELAETYRAELSKFGTGPYIGITWQAGPQLKKSKQGIRLLDKFVDPAGLASTLSNLDVTIVNLQRFPDSNDLYHFSNASSAKFADYSNLNDDLEGMLAMLSVLDEYVTVSNTNLHLREGLGLSSHVFINRPFQDWRWLSQGLASPWYPNSFIYRQSIDKSWQSQLVGLAEVFTDGAFHTKAKSSLSPNNKNNEVKISVSANKKSLSTHAKQLIDEGWEKVSYDIPTAVKNAQQVLEQYPDHPSAMHLLGWAAMQDLKFELGLSVLETAVNLEPANGNIWRDYVRAHVLVNQSAKAVSVGLECLSRKGVWAKGVVHFAIGAAYLTLDNELDALKHFEQCLSMLPNHLDAATAAGMTRMRLGDGYAMQGLKLNSARIEARQDEFMPYWVCPILKGDVKGLNVLIVRSMGFGDELSYLRYLPYLINAGVKVTYWCGIKLVPILERSPYPITLIPDTEPMPDPSAYDLAFIKNELPGAVEHLGSPEIADPLPLTINKDKLEKWRAWLKAQGDGPYIGVTWRAGVGGNIKDGFGYTRLSKKVELSKFAKALSGINATWISLQRNVTKIEINEFEQSLGYKVADVAGETDDLDDLMCIQYLLAENIGVSNTNMHLRASLGLGSKVLVSDESRDWRWGIEGHDSTWFKKSKVYRHEKDDGWENALKILREDLAEQYGINEHENQKLAATAIEKFELTKRIIWITAGEVSKTESGYYSPLSSAQERVINVSNLLATQEWHSDFLIESVSELMGGWHGTIPQPGDVVVFSKVFTDHAITLMKDAKARGAVCVVDVFNDFSTQPQREIHQKKLISHADLVVCSSALTEKLQREGINPHAIVESVTGQLSNKAKQTVLRQWSDLLTNSHDIIGSSHKENPHALRVASKKVLVGMMFSGENEYPEAIEALQKQTHQNYELIEVKNLPNKEAHDTLYTSFMKRASEFDFFLKLDADMVFASKGVLTEMIEAMVDDNLGIMLAYVKDQPSALMIPGIQMFRSDTKWLGSDEQLNVDYPPKVNGDSKIEVDKPWILHMPNPSRLQLFRYGIHKALKATQPDRSDKSIKKALLHINILCGIFRRKEEHPDLIWSLMGATLVFSQKFKGIDYNNDFTHQFYQQLSNQSSYNDLLRLTKSFWTSEIQAYYRWIDLFNANTAFEADKVEKPKPKPIEKLASQSSVEPVSKRLIWITAGKLDDSLGYVSSAMASTRYRVLLPAANLGPLGWSNEIVNEAELVQHGSDKLNLQSSDVVVVSKALDPKLIDHLNLIKNKGCKVIVDFCDNHFDDDDYRGQLDRQLLTYADLVIATTPQLASDIRAITQTNVVQITDCFEGEKHEPSFNPSTPLKLLWFGNFTNHDTLPTLFKSLETLSHKQAIELDIVTIHEQGDEAAANASKQNFKVNYIPWNPISQAKAIKRCDMVVIPTLDNKEKSVKSPNRVIEPLWAGKYVVAGNIPSYQPFSDFAAIDDDLVKGIQWAIENPKLVSEKIQAGQAYIAKHHTPKLIGKLWAKAIDSLSSDHSSLPISHEKTSQAIPPDINNKLLIVISYYQATNIEHLLNLLNSIDRYDPGCEIDVLVVVNSVSDEKINISLKQHNLEVVYRENTGMNIGAWDYGWRYRDNYENYLFLQDECFVLADNWAVQFIEVLKQDSVGMVGESINLKWDLAWPDLNKHQSLGARAKKYQAFMHANDIPSGQTAKHLRSLIWGFTQDTLRKINGFPIGNNKTECVAAEIAVSKQVEFLKLECKQVDEHQPCRHIKHQEWSMNNKKIPITFDTNFQYGDIYSISDEHYRVKPRLDMFSLINRKPSRVCEIGCADGTNLIEVTKYLEIELKKDNLVGVDIEENTQCHNYDAFTFFHQTAESFVESYSGNKFDLVLLSDVVEHLYNPWVFFEKLKGLLSPNAEVIISVPNIQNLNYLHAVNNGAFYYQKTGLMDVTHIRFFSVETLAQLLETAGLTIIKQTYRPDLSLSDLRSNLETQISSQGKASIQLENINLSVSRTELDRYFSQQILVSCKVE